MKERDSYFDTAKGILIFLVVLGHFTGLMLSDPLIRAVNNVIYSFHMPAFVFVSGYFSKSITTFRFADSFRLLYIFFIFQFAHFAFRLVTGSGDGSLNLLIPAHQNWYLLALFLWRLWIPLTSYFSKRWVLVTLTLLSLVVGLFSQFNSFLGLYRIIYFFPLFMVGYYVRDFPTLVKHFSGSKIFIISIAALLLLAIFGLSIMNTSFGSKITYAYTPFNNYNHDLKNLVLRLIGFFSSVFIAFAFLLTIPSTQSIFTRFGKYSMNTFLLHMFIVWPLGHVLAAIPAWCYLITAIVTSYALCLTLSTEIITKLLKPFTQPDFLIRRGSKS